MDLFRCRCYLASLQGGEPPNPKRLLGFASRPTKLAMGRLGIFSVSSFHALVNVHAPAHVYELTHLCLCLTIHSKLPGLQFDSET